MSRRPSQEIAAGFTLIEVLVALAVVAIALAAGTQASGALVRNAERQSVQFLAQICAENQLVQMRLSRQLPDVGESNANCQQAGQSFTVQLQVAPTPNPNFRRVDARVEGTQTDGAVLRLLTLSTVVGRY